MRRDIDGPKAEEFDTFLREHSAMAYRFAHQGLGPGIAHDICHEAWIELRHGWPHWPGRPVIWLYKLLRRHMARWRAAQRRFNPFSSREQLALTRQEASFLVTQAALTIRQTALVMGVSALAVRRHVKRAQPGETIEVTGAFLAALVERSQRAYAQRRQEPELLRALDESVAASRRDQPLRRHRLRNWLTLGSRGREATTGLAIWQHERLVNLRPRLVELTARVIGEHGGPAGHAERIVADVFTMAEVYLHDAPRLNPARFDAWLERQIRSRVRVDFGR